MAEKDERRTAALQGELDECDAEIAKWRTRRAVVKALAACGGVVPGAEDEPGFTEWAACLRTELAEPGAAKPTEDKVEIGTPVVVEAA